MGFGIIQPQRDDSLVVLTAAFVPQHRSLYTYSTAEQREKVSIYDDEVRKWEALGPINHTSPARALRAEGGRDSMKWLLCSRPPESFGFCPRSRLVAYIYILGCAAAAFSWRAPLTFVFSLAWQSSLICCAAAVVQLAMRARTKKAWLISRPPDSKRILYSTRSLSSEKEREREDALWKLLTYLLLLLEYRLSERAGR